MLDEKSVSTRWGARMIKGVFSAARFCGFVGLQILIHARCHLAPFGDGPDDEGGAALGIAAGVGLIIGILLARK